jgi:thioredoxin-like negative regulator of GroEL
MIKAAMDCEKEDYCSALRHLSSALQINPENQDAIDQMAMLESQIDGC